jgi:hypothetical protein
MRTASERHRGSSGHGGRLSTPWLCNETGPSKTTQHPYRQRALSHSRDPRLHQTSRKASRTFTETRPRKTPHLSPTHPTPPSDPRLCDANTGFASLPGCSPSTAATPQDGCPPFNGCPLLDCPSLNSCPPSMAVHHPLLTQQNP